MLISAAPLAPRERVSGKLDLHWSADIGLTTHRTRPAFTSEHIFIGSNGSHFQDHAIDRKNGVIVLDKRTGRQVRSHANESFGDMDVNGVLRIGERIIFGNDNDEVYCFNTSGEKLWRIPTSGDVEHHPTHIKIAGKDVVVFASEMGEVRALNAEDGSTVWSHYNEGFSGWKQGDNRTVFKVKMHFTAGEDYFNEPGVADLNGDGVDDLIYNYNYGELIALSGRTGKKLWGFTGVDEMKSSLGKLGPQIIGKGSKTRIPVLMYDHVSQTQRLVTLNRKGEVIDKKKLDKHSYPLLSQTSDYYLLNDRILPFDKDGFRVKKSNELFVSDGKNIRSRFYSGQVADQKVKFMGEECAVIVYQRDSKMKTGQALLVLMGLTTGKFHLESYLPDGSEFIPVVKDVTGDGKLDVLVGCYDEKLYCFDLNIDNKNLIK